MHHHNRHCLRHSQPSTGVYMWCIAMIAATWLSPCCRRGTSRMLLEAALCLALQQQELDASEEVQKGGVLTPASGEGGGLLGVHGCASKATANHMPGAVRLQGLRWFGGPHQWACFQRNAQT